MEATLEDVPSCGVEGIHQDASRKDSTWAVNIHQNRMGCVIFACACCQASEYRGTTFKLQQLTTLRILATEIHAGDAEEDLEDFFNLPKLPLSNFESILFDVSVGDFDRGFALVWGPMNPPNPRE